MIPALIGYATIALCLATLAALGIVMCTATLSKSRCPPCRTLP